MNKGLYIYWDWYEQNKRDRLEMRAYINELDWSNPDSVGGCISLWANPFGKGTDPSLFAPVMSKILGTEWAL